MPLYVQRSDSAATHLGSDGESGHVLLVDANGKLWVSAAFGASEDHIGSVGGESKITTTVMSLHTDANVVNDVLAATQEIANAVRVNDGTGVIQTIVVQDDDDNGGDIDLVFFSANTSIGSESATVSMADNDTVLGIVEVASGDYVDMINSQVATLVNVGIAIQGATGVKSIYLGIVARNTDTYSASGITVRLGILQD